ncbi:MAG: glycoside hydrolase family 31 protein [Victivallaceae bacterium]|nr:glycoside hydrolase family 31 protein [Victivallaceae bacterium]
MLENTAFALAPAHEGNTWSGNRIRITFITPRMVRFEWAEDGCFEDRQTLAVLNRDCGIVPFKVGKSASNVTLSSADVTLTIADDGRKFTASNCQAQFKVNAKPVVWHCGDADKGNLKGTCRTLDGCRGDRHYSSEKPEGEPIQLGNGFLSRDGWSVIDDSSNVVVVKRGARKWIAPRSDTPRQDFYVLFYGHEYKNALRAAGEVFGSQPLPPRFAFGYWFSRYWAYSDTEIEEIADQFDRYDVPIDVMVVDMDWHLEGWTGYTWDRRYFPDPDEFLAHLHRKGLKITLNLHPADGVGRHEVQFEKMARAMGLDPAKIDRVPFDITDPKYMKNYFSILHHPEEKRGVDFWWMDWQQGSSTAMRGLDTLPWINHLHWEDMQLHAGTRRPMIFSRFGGVGAGRYVIGFSGDTYSTWESLQYQPYFTATAANVLYGYWSHDLGGHMPGKIEPELYLRWLQFGMYSPIMRTHTTKNRDAERRIYAYAEPFGSQMAEVIRRRYELVPYLYSESRKACDSAVSLVHPLYYDFPEDEESYKATGEYFFGEKMLVAPVVVPAEDGMQHARVDLYLPEGLWYDTAAGEMLEGGKWFRRRFYAWEDVPVFVRPGTVIPGQSNARRLNDRCYRNLLMTVYPGIEGQYSLYEDDGTSQEYRKAKCATISMRHKLSGTSHLFEVRHESGTYPEWEKSRVLELRIAGAIPPESVKVGSRCAARVFRLEEDCAAPVYCYDADRAETIVRCGVVDLDAGCRIVATYASDDPFSAVDGFKRRMSLMRTANEFHKLLFRGKNPVGDERLCQQLAHTGRRISMKPETLAAELADFERNFPALLRSLRKSPEDLTDEERKLEHALKSLLEACR